MAEQNRRGSVDERLDSVRDKINDARNAAEEVTGRRPAGQADDVLPEDHPTSGEGDYSPS